MNIQDALNELATPLGRAITGDRAEEIVQTSVSAYNHLKAIVPPGKSLNLICLIGGKEYDVHQVTGRNDVVTASVEDKAGKRAMTIRCPIEQIGFAIVLSDKTDQKAPREITGFKQIAPQKAFH
jgi:hypothetical protein